MPEPNLIAALRDLRQREIQFIVVGDLAAVLNGAPVPSYDVGLAYSRDHANIDRLLNFWRKPAPSFGFNPKDDCGPTKATSRAAAHLIY